MQPITPVERDQIRQLKPAPAPLELHHPDLLAIWEIYEKSKLIALAKNADYGSSFNKAPVLAPQLEPASAILVRMSDKINRLGSLMGKENQALVAESIDDTINDLGCYAFLYLVAKKTQKGK